MGAASGCRAWNDELRACRVDGGREGVSAAAPVSCMSCPLPNQPMRVPCCQPGTCLPTRPSGCPQPNPLNPESPHHELVNGRPTLIGRRWPLPGLLGPSRQLALHGHSPDQASKLICASGAALTQRDGIPCANQDKPLYETHAQNVCAGRSPSGMDSGRSLYCGLSASSSSALTPSFCRVVGSGWRGECGGEGWH